MNFSDTSTGCIVALVVGAHVVLDPPDALDLTLDVRAVFARLLDDLGRLAGVFLDVQMRAVEQDRVPARLQAGGRPFAVGAMVEVKSDRHGCIVGHSVEHLVEHLGPDRLHRLEGRLDDQRRVELGSRVDHRPQADVVDDVESRDAVPLLEGGVENVSEGDDGHFDRASLSGICPLMVSLRGPGWSVPLAEVVAVRVDEHPPGAGRAVRLARAFHSKSTDGAMPSRSSACDSEAAARERCWPRPRSRTVSAGTSTWRACRCRSRCAGATRG